MAEILASFCVSPVPLVVWLTVSNTETTPPVCASLVENLWWSVPAIGDNSPVEFAKSELSSLGWHSADDSSVSERDCNVFPVGCSLPNGCPDSSSSLVKTPLLSFCSRSSVMFPVVVNESPVCSSSFGAHLSVVEIASVELVSGRVGANVLVFTAEFTATASGGALIPTVAFWGSSSEAGTWATTWEDVCVTALLSGKEWENAADLSCTETTSCWEEGLLSILWPTSDWNWEDSFCLASEVFSCITWRVPSSLFMGSGVWSSSCTALLSPERGCRWVGGNEQRHSTNMLG